MPFFCLFLVFDHDLHAGSVVFMSHMTRSCTAISSVTQSSIERDIGNVSPQSLGLY